MIKKPTTIVRRKGVPMEENEGWLPDLTDMPLSELRESQDPALLRAVEKVKRAAEEPPMVQEWCD